MALEFLLNPGIRLAFGRGCDLAWFVDPLWMNPTDKGHAWRQIGPRRWEKAFGIDRPWACLPGDERFQEFMHPRDGRQEHRVLEMDVAEIGKSVRHVGVAFELRVRSQLRCFLHERHGGDVGHVCICFFMQKQCQRHSLTNVVMGVQVIQACNHGHCGQHILLPDAPRFPSDLVGFSMNKRPGLNRTKAVGTGLIVLSSLGRSCWLRVPATSS